MACTTSEWSAMIIRRFMTNSSGRAVEIIWIPRRHDPHATGLPRQAQAREAEVRAERPQGRPAERIRPP